MPVYFVKPRDADGPIKVGHSCHPLTRLQSLNCWSPVPLEIMGQIPGDPVLERRLHAKLEPWRSHGEWFHPAPEVRATVAAAIDGTLDASALPPPKDIRVKNQYAPGCCHLATSLAVRMDRIERKGVRVPARVREAQRRFTGYRAGVPRLAADAYVLADFVGQHIPHTATFKARLNDVFPAASDEARKAAAKREAA